MAYVLRSVASIPPDVKVRLPGSTASFVIFFVSVGEGLVITVAPAFLQYQGYALANIGLLVSVTSIASLLMRMPAGRLAEGRRARWWFALGCFGVAAGISLYPVAGSEPIAFWLTRALHGASSGLVSTITYAVFLNESSERPASERPRATALFTTALAGGYSLGNVASGAIADRFGFQAAFWTAALCPLIALAVGYRAPGPRPARSRVETGKPSVQTQSVWRTLLTNPNARAMPVFAFGMNFFNGLLNTLFPLYILSIGYTLSLAGTARGVQSITNMLVRPVSGRVTARVRPLMLGCFGIVMCALGVAAVGMTTLPVLLLIAFFFVGIGRAAGVLSSTLDAVNLSERGVLKRGTASALLNMSQDAGAIVGPAIAGATAAAIGIGPALLVIPLAAAILSLFAVLAGRGTAETAST